MAPPKKSKPFSTIRVNLESVAAPPRSEVEGAALAETLVETEPFVAPIAPANEARHRASEKPVDSAKETRAPAPDLEAPAARAPTIVDFSEIQTLAAQALRTNVEEQFAFMGALLRSQSVSEAVALQGAHFRRQYEDFTSQWKNLSAAALRLGARKD